MLYLFLDRGGNSLDNNLLFFAEPGNINIETKLDSFLYELKSQDQKNQELYEEYKKITRFRDDNLTLLEQNSML
jgi:hypothetical protein